MVVPRAQLSRAGGRAAAWECALPELAAAATHARSVCARHVIPASGRKEPSNSLMSLELQEVGDGRDLVEATPSPPLPTSLLRSRAWEAAAA